MVIFNTQGIVLRTSRYSENDVILTIFTRNLGKVSAIAKGAKRNKSALLPSAQLFAYSNFTLKKQRGMYRVSQSEIIKSFYDISYDIDAFSYASYISRLVENALLEDQTNQSLFNLIVKTMYLLTQKDVDKEFITAAFELKFSECMGFRPITDRCSICGDKSDQRAIFNIEEGGILCKKCSENFSGNIRLDITTRKLMNYILANEIETVSKARVNNVLTKELSKLMKQYLTAYVSNLNMKSLNILDDLHKF